MSASDGRKMASFIRCETTAFAPLACLLHRHAALQPPPPRLLALAAAADSVVASGTLGVDSVAAAAVRAAEPLMTADNL